MISVAIVAARSAPRSEPAKSHDLRALGRVVREADPAVVDESREGARPGLGDAT
jgi:hypothetical protein